MSTPTHGEPGQVSNAELAAQDPSGRLYNDDLAPSAPSERKWNGYQLFSLWMNDAHNAGNYTWAAGLFILGLSPIDVTIGILGGAIIIMVGCCLSGFMGHATGTPYPVISRMTWGIWGANIPALIRGVVAIAWYGIQTYLASIALQVLLVRFVPGVGGLTGIQFLGLSLAGWLSFLLLSLLQLTIVWRGMEAVRHFQGMAGPIIWVVMLALMFWMLWQADWDISWTTGGHGERFTGSEQVMWIAIAMAQTVGTLATLMLNFSDFARYAPDRKAIITGNAWGLPLNWTAFAVTSVITSAASVKVYGEAVLDPAKLLEKVDNNVIFFIGTAAFVFATIGVNIVANFVSAAFDISNANPRRISFRTGGIITACVSILVTPWNLFNNPIVIGKFLGSLGALLGPFFGILVVDYFLVRRQQFSLKHMYLPNKKSIYYFNNGVSRFAMTAFIPAAIVALCIAHVPAFEAWKDFGWFIGAPLAGLIYYFVAKGKVIVTPGEADTASAPASEDQPA